MAMLNFPECWAKWATSWRRRTQDSLIFIVTFAPMAVALRYKWAELILPLAAFPLAVLLAGSSESRAAVADTFSAWLRSAVGILSLMAGIWLSASPLWGPDAAFAANNAVKAVGIIAAALVVMAVLKTIPADRIFPLLILFTTSAICIAMFTALSGGLAHRAVGCCRNGMQADMTGSAVTIALFVWPCIGWLVLKGQRLYAVLIFILACLLIAVSKSGAAGLALLAGSVALALGLLLPRLAATAAIIVTLLSFVAAPLLGDFGHLLGTSGMLDHLTKYHAGERLQIWSYYIDLFWQRPWVGFSIGAERLLGDPARAAEFTSLAPPRYADLHPHNAPLQVLFEFGIIGAVLALALAGAAVGRLYVRPHAGLAFALASGVAFFAAGVVNFSLWESWWLSVVSLAFIFSARLAQHAASSSRVG